MMADSRREPEQSRLNKFIATMGEFLYGMSGLEFERHAQEMRASLETVFMVVTVGDMLGLPVIPPMYALRILPYVLPLTATWKRRVLRERDFSESDEFDLHGV
jgi:hypothetical protein